MSKSVLVLVLMLLCIAKSSYSQKTASISGFVKNNAGEFIEGVTIKVNNTLISTVSNKEGFFNIRKIPAGKQVLQFSFVGYNDEEKMIDLNAGEEYELVVSLYEKHIMLSEVTIKAPLHVPGGVKRLPEINQTYIISGKKNEAIAVEGMNANIAEKTGRQIFAKIPGAFIYDMDGSGNQVNISTRGLDPHRSWEFNVRQNGIMTNSDIYGYPASHYSAPMESIGKIELIRGTASLQYGAAFGGMINYITKSPDTSKPFEFESISSAGSFGLMSTYNAIGGKTGKLTYHAYFSKRVSDGYRDNARSNYNAQFVLLNYAFNENISLKGELGHMNYIYQIPGPLTDSMFYRNQRQSTRSRNYFNPDIYIPSISLDWKLSSKTKVNFTTSSVLGHRNSVQLLAFANVSDTIARNTGMYKTRQVDIDNFNSYSAELRLIHDYEIVNISNTLSAGFRLIKNNLHRQQLGKGTTGSDFDLSLPVPGFGRDLNYKTINAAVYVENLIRLTKQLSITPGFRYENGRTDMKGTISYYNPGDVPNTIYHQFPLFGVSSQYSFKNGNRVYAGWAEAYRPVIFSDIIPPTPLDKTDKNLKDATGHTLEIGISGRVRNPINYDVSLFAIKYNDRIGSIVEADANGNNFILKTNVGTSITKGVEMFIELKPLELLNINQYNIRLSVFSSTSYFDAYYAKGSVIVNNINKSIKGNKLETVPEWISRNGVSVGYKGFNSTIQYSYVSKSFSDAFNTVEPNSSGSAGIVPSYGVLDMNTSYRINQHLTFRLGLNNVANKQYFTKRPSGYPGPGVWPSDGRSVVGTIQIKL